MIPKCANDHLSLPNVRALLLAQCSRKTYIHSLQYCPWYSIYTVYIIIFIFSFQATAWVTLFLSLEDNHRGYAKENITPYIHAMVYHVPRSMTMHKGIQNFSGQGK